MKHKSELELLCFRLHLLGLSLAQFGPMQNDWQQEIVQKSKQLIDSLYQQKSFFMEKREESEVFVPELIRKLFLNWTKFLF